MMNGNRPAITMVLSLLAGLIGGGLSQWLLSPGRVLAQAAVQQDIKARSLAILDSEGRTRVSIGGEGLTVNNVEGDRRIFLGVHSEDAAALEISGKFASVSLADTLNNRRVQISSLEGAQSQVHLSTGRGSLHATLLATPIGAKGTVLFALEDDTSHGDRIRLLLGAEPYLQVLEFIDHNRKKRARLSLDSEGKPGLTMLDEEGTSRAVLGATELETIRTGEVRETPESSLTLFDREGKVLRSLP